MNTGKLLIGVLAGVAAGALLGILFAPDKGSETRKKVAKKGQDYADDLKDRFNEFVNTANDKFEKTKEDVSDYANHAKSKMNSSKSEAKNY